MSDALLEVKNLQVQYKTDLETVYAVNDISFAIPKGSTLGLVGETGAGKTTTALSILRLLPERIGIIKNGSIVFNGKNLLDISEEEIRSVRGNKIAMIFQDPMTSLNPVHTIGEQIREVLVLHNEDGKSKKQIDQRVEEVLRMVGIDPKRKHEYPHQFSGGMKQRVVIAMALACEPTLLIADEPTTALDVTIQAQVLNVMRRLRDELRTSMLMITHDFGVVAYMCDYVAVMYAGEIVEIGTLSEVYTGSCHHPYTMGLFGAIPKISDSSRRLNPIDGIMPDPTIDLPGCRFAPRCPYRMDICNDKHPITHVFSHTHRVCCHLYKED